MAEEKLNRFGDGRGMSPTSRKNLEKGRKTNRNNANGYSVTRKIREILELESDYILPGAPAGERTWGDLVAWSIVIGAVRGDARKQAELLDRVDGKVTIPIGGEGGQPIQVTVIEKIKDYGTAKQEKE